MFEATGEVCAWIIARDACFVLQVLESFREGEDANADKSVWASIDRILSRKRHHPLLTEIVKDMLKMGNQLPFWVLEAIRPNIVEWYQSALKNLSPIEVADVDNYRLFKMCTSRVYNEESHILQLLHDYIVDRQEIPVGPRQRPGPPDDAPRNSGSIGLSIIILLYLNPFLCLYVLGCDIDWDYSHRLWQWMKRTTYALNGRYGNMFQL
ncbi:hypothetical protein SUGI_0181220 [Cryptomeria japonica]|nr:hypothetical protein SUGI_0181220 [Cryptomeria japonica]